MDRKSSQKTTQNAGSSRKRKTSGSTYNRQKDTSFASTSAKKLRITEDMEIVSNPTHGYRIIAFQSVFNSISELVICKKCKQEVEFGESSVHGIGFKLSVRCKCNTRYINSSPLIDDKSFEVNRRLIYVMRLLGIGKEGLNFFCGLMDLSQGISNPFYYAAMENIYHGAKAVFDVLMKKAAEEEKMENFKHGLPNTLTVSANGTWKKRGFDSLFGITTFIGKYTGKVIDLDVQSAYCDVCKLWEPKRGSAEYNIWMNEHMDECLANYDVSAEKMEVDSVKEMLRRPHKQFQMQLVENVDDKKTKSLEYSLNDNDLEYVEKQNLDGEIQNNNNSFNTIIWRLIPEHFQCRTKSIETAAYLAASICNEGLYAVLKTMTTIGIIIGEQTKVFFNGRENKSRLRLSRRYSNTKAFEYSDFYDQEEMIL